MNTRATPSAVLPAIPWTKLELHVLLWSRSRNEIKVEKLQDLLSRHRLAYGADMGPTDDWVPLFVDYDVEMLRATAGRCVNTLSDRAVRRVREMESTR